MFHPRCDPEVERPKLDKVPTHVVEKEEFQPNLVNHLQKLSNIKPMSDKTQKTERKSSDIHRSTPLLSLKTTV